MAGRRLGCRICAVESRCTSVEVLVLAIVDGVKEAAHKRRLIITMLIVPEPLSGALRSEEKACCLQWAFSSAVLFEALEPFV